MRLGSWDKRWEKVFRTQEWGKYPPEELVRFIAHNYYSVKNRKAIKILDLGCGTGAASWYMAREGFAVSGIDGSPTGIKAARARFKKEKLKGRFCVGDIIALPYADETFEVVVDIAAIQHNSPAHIKKIISEMERVLKPGGKFFGMMLAISDAWHLGDYTKHFFTLGELIRIFGTFDKVVVDSTARTKNNRKSSLKFWLVEATKRTPTPIGYKPCAD